MTTVKNYLSLVKFSHTIFALPFALIGFVLGYNHFRGAAWWGNNYEIQSEKFVGLNDLSSEGLLLKFLLVIVCMVTARSAAMAFNRYLDRSFDAKNPRTAIREIPRGIISPQSALRFTIICCILFAAACYFINRICFYLAPVALFVILFY